MTYLISSLIASDVLLHDCDWGTNLWNETITYKFKHYYINLYRRHLSRNIQKGVVTTNTILQKNS